MVQLLYKYDKCSECGHEGFQWGMKVENIFICHNCLKTALEKLDDMIEEANRLPKANENELKRIGSTTLRSHSVCPKHTLFK